MRHLESKVQQAYFEWAKRHPIAKRAFAIPNGGARNKVTAAILKAEGVTAGVVDVFLPYPAFHSHGLWIEFKAGKGSLTPEQREFLADKLALSYCCCVAYDAALAVTATIEYLHGRLPPGVLHILKR